MNLVSALACERLGRAERSAPARRLTATIGDPGSEAGPMRQNHTQSTRGRLGSGRALATLSALASAFTMLLTPAPGAAEPTMEEFLPLTATVVVRDSSFMPLTQMVVQAVNHEFGLRAQTETDGNGIAVFRLMPGTWDFVSMPTHSGMWSHPNQGYYLVATDEVFTDSWRQITLEPDTTVTVNLESAIFDFAARENYLGFVHSPWGKFLEAKPAGVTTAGQPLTLHTNAGLTAAAYVASPRTEGELLYFVTEPAPLVSPLTIEVTEANSALLAIDATDAAGAPTDYHVQLKHLDFTWTWSPWYTDAVAGQPGVRLAPGTYQMLRAVDAWQDSTRYRLMLNPTVVSLEVGEELALSMGGPLQVQQVRATPRAAADFAPACQIWLPVRDASDNAVLFVDTWTRGRVVPTVHVEYDSQTSPPFAVNDLFIAWLGEQFDRQDDPTYHIDWDFGPWGAGSRSGDLYGQAERRQSIHETESLLAQAPRMLESYRLPQVQDHDRQVQAMAEAIGVPVDFQLGVISNIAYSGFEDEVQHGYKTEIFIDAGLASAWPAGHFFLDHEAGHGRIHKPPCRFYAYGYFGETYATLAGMKGRSLLFGGEEYLTYLLGNHDKFLHHQHGDPLQYPGDHIETLQFVTHYLNTMYGWRPHQRMILEWDNALRGARQALANSFYSFSDPEQFAILYSWLCGENLWALFTAAGFWIESDAIDAGLAVIDSYITATGLRLAIGYNAVIAPRTSIPVELIAPAPGLSTIEATIEFDPDLATVRSICARDLALSPDCTMTFEEVEPGIVTIQISSTTPLLGVGSVAQVNLDLKPGASPALPFTITSATADGAPIPTLDGALALPDTPLVIPFPTLPEANCGEAYSMTLTATAGWPPYTWTLLEDDLPPGFTLDGSTGEISGASSQHGEYLFRLAATDDNNRTGTRWFTISVGLPGDLDDDGDVDQSDLGLLLASYDIDAGGDCDGDGDTDQSDLGILLAHYGEQC